MILLVTEHKISCYRAAKIMGIPYTNAKILYRTYRLENRIVQEPRYYRNSKNKDMPTAAQIQAVFLQPENLAKARRLAKEAY